MEELRIAAMIAAVAAMIVGVVIHEIKMKAELDAVAARAAYW